ncbi:toll-like receptor 5b [Aplochiton taeniatus]
MRYLLAIWIAAVATYLPWSWCDPFRCQIRGSVANCAFLSLRSVPRNLPPNITHLSLGSNDISEINETSFAGLKALQYLDLGLQNVPRLVVRNNAFQKLGNLTKLDLGYNRGLVLEPNAFAGLYSLTSLSLYYCSLTNAILEGSYLQPLVSLETLDVSLNSLTRIRPGLFFVNMTKFTELNIRLNAIKSICEDDLSGLQGKHFRLLRMDSIHLLDMSETGFDWGKCGNPFKDMSFEELDLSSNGFTVTRSKLFLKAIRGTKIDHLLLGSRSLGKGFSHKNIEDPTFDTFQSLRYSAITNVDLSKTSIFALNPEVFSALEEAIIIDLSQSKINQINVGAFNGMQGHLRLLNLSQNLLGEIYSYTLNNLTDLRVLDLSYNHIGVLENLAFSDLPNLKMLILTGNSIRHLHALSPLPNIEFLYLDDNKLNEGSVRSVIDFASKSTHLNIGNNRMRNLEDVYLILSNFKRLKNLLYGGNFVSWCVLNGDIPVPLSNNLEVLDLHSSSLQTVWAQGKCLNLFRNLGKLIALGLRRNSLQYLPDGIFDGLTSVIEMDLSENSLTYLQPDIFPASLNTLNLSYNYLSSPDPATFDSLGFLDLTMNLFHCDCHLRGFLVWLNHTNVTFQGPVEELRCKIPNALYNVPLLNLSQTVECEQDKEQQTQELRLVLFITCASLLFLVTVGAIAYAHLRGHIFTAFQKVKRRVLEGGEAAAPLPGYDVFLCFSENDYKWVEKALLKKLDGQFSERNILRCCFEARDFLPGEDHLSNIRDAVWGSRKTVCIVSEEFLKDGWCLEAFNLAQGRMLEELKDMLIMVVVGRMPLYKLMKHEAVRSFVQKKEYLVWPEDTQDMEWFYEKLVSMILKDSEVKKKGVEVAKENAVELAEINAV